MKNICVLIGAFLLGASAANSQSDSTIYLRDTDFSIYKTRMVIFQSTSEKKELIESTDLDNVSALTFFQNDSLSLISETGSPVYTRLGDINEVSKYNKHLDPFLGITLGAIGGGILGMVIGGSIYSYEPKTDGNLFDPIVNRIGNAASRTSGTIVGALIGAVGGGVLGAVITNAINHASLELFSVPDKDRKSELVKFLRQK